eukprot:TRINITY_DN2643_c0_g2_i1.p1 TRINITY_DN2643_c0_g2~~TRINITY_DN2643_c0_g2_i1.p1  ORF type:complete len:486 (-),score=93.64 TRINITY_DN2643_c0_g2_i1:70-1527(-)
MSGKGRVKEGFLTKEGGKRKTWRKRWCVLQPATGTLFYHAKKGGKLKGKISLRYCGEIAPINYKNKKNCFCMRTPDRMWYLCAETPRDVQEWIDELKKVRDYQKGSDVEPTNKPLTTVQAARTTSPPTQQSGLKEIPQRVASTPLGTKAPDTSSQPQGEKRIDESDFIKLKVIGRGSFGKVFKVQKQGSNEVYAMKVLNKTDVAERNEVTHARAENSILRKLDCPFLVRMHFAFQNEEKLFFVMDFVNGGELFFHLQKEGKFAEDRVRFYVAEIVLGLEYLHSKGIIYRDLKPENLLLSADGHIIMTDFGISKEGLKTTDDRTGTFCGTPEYLAPEVLKQEPYSKAVDWWSLGTLMYEMLSGLPPFYTEEVQNMYYNIINTKLTMPKGTNSATQSLLNGLLEKDPNTRLSDPSTIKAHPFFKGIDWEKLNIKGVTPPYVPPVKDKMDDTQISPEFTDDTIEDNEPKVKLPNAKPLHFEGFTFVGK